MQLTPEQAAIIAHQDSHAKVVAVAGSGKTTTLCEFIAAKIEQGIPAKRLLVLMYNRSTREDFDKRLQARLQGQAKADVRTFHALGFKIYQSLIRQGALAAIDTKPLSQAQFESQVWRLMLNQADANLRQQLLDNKQTWLEPTLEFFEHVKACLDPPEVVFERLGLNKKLAFAVEVFKQFEAWRKQEKRITYADMLYDPAMAFAHQKDLIERFSGHMYYILVDEYQDINRTQQFLLDVLLAKRGYLIAIGDPDQTIYEFRGSQPEFMTTTFEEKYPQHKNYDLSYSFRYGHQTALASNYLLRKTALQQTTLTQAHASNGATHIELMKYDVNSRQGQMGELKTLITQLQARYNLTDIAILNRLWAGAAQVELLCLQDDIPYQLDHNISVLQRSELKPFFILFGFASGAYQQLSRIQRQRQWFTLLTQPYPKIKKATLEKIALTLASIESDFAKTFYKLSHRELSSWQLDQLINRLDIVDFACKKPQAAKVVTQWLQICDYLDFLREDGFSKQQSDDKVATVKAFQHFLQTLPIDAGEIENYLNQKLQQRKTQGGLTISSIHKAKGLEWPVVIMPSVNQYFYPYINESEQHKKQNKAKLYQAERRLLYVAMTRAKEALYLFSPKQLHQQSPLLQECRLSSVKIIGHALEAKPQDIYLPEQDTPIATGYLGLHHSQTRVLNHQDNANTHAGQLIHKDFGPGHLIAENQDYFTIKFNNGSTKKLKKSIAQQHIQWTA